MKRRTIADFFHSTPKERPSKVLRTENERTLSTQLDVPGLKLIADFVSAEEESTLLRFLDSERWRTDLSRRVIHYGGSYCLMPPRWATAEEKNTIESNIIVAEPIPAALEFVLRRMIEEEIYNEIDKPSYCIVNEYKDNQGISAHVENFKFISPVCGLTLANGDWIRFHELAASDDGSVRSGKAAKAQRTGRRSDVWMPRRSLLVMSGDSRDRWQHEIVKSKRGRTGNNWRRISLTFRAEKRRLF